MIPVMEYHASIVPKHEAGQLTDQELAAYILTWNSVPAGYPETGPFWYKDKDWIYLRQGIVEPDPKRLAYEEERLSNWSRAAVASILDQPWGNDEDICD
jgi:hypothetical protein